MEQRREGKSKFLFKRQEAAKAKALKNLHKKKKKCMFRFSDKNRVRWDMFVIVLAIWNCFSIPYSLAFEPVAFNNPAFRFFDYFIDFLFLIDIIVAFRTTFFNKVGDEVYNGWQIAANYIFGGRFFLDLLASLPFAEMFSVGSLEIFGILKLTRITRIGKIIAKLDLRDDSKAMVKVGQLLFFLIIYLHCLGCMWFAIVTSESLWIAPRDWIYPEGISKIYENPEDA